MNDWSDSISTTCILTVVAAAAATLLTKLSDEIDFDIFSK